MNNPNRLEIKGPLVLILVIILIVGILFFTLNKVNQARRELVYQKYEAETNQFIQKNQDNLIKLFTEVFPNTTCDSNYYPGSPTSTCTTASSEEIANLTDQNLKDWSSTEFIKKSNGKVITMNLSGDTYEFRSSYNGSDNKSSKILDLLNGAVDKIQWDDYTYDFSGKEIVIPVRDKNAQIIGAIVRGVIEKSN